MGPLGKRKKKEQEWENGTWRKKGIKHRELEYRDRGRKKERIWPWRGGRKGTESEEEGVEHESGGIEHKSGGDLRPILTSNLAG